MSTWVFNFLLFKPCNNFDLLFMYILIKTPTKFNQFAFYSICICSASVCFQKKLNTLLDIFFSIEKQSALQSVHNCCLVKVKVLIFRVAIICTIYSDFFSMLWRAGDKLYVWQIRCTTCQIFSRCYIKFYQLIKTMKFVLTLE